MDSKSSLHPAPTYFPLETHWDTDDDAPGPRCGHTLTAVAPTKSHGPRLILFGGATAIEGGASSANPGIRLAGVTNSVHSYDLLTKKWTRLLQFYIVLAFISNNLLRNQMLICGYFFRMRPAGEAPSPRAAHAAAAVGTMVVYQGGIGPAGHSTDDLFVLDLTNDKYKWHRVVVQGQGPGPRYGHAMDLVAHRYLVTVSGNDGKKVLSDAWALDTAQKPYAWLRLNTDGDKPSARMYATASARSDGGALRGGRVVEGEAAIAVFDSAAGVWLDRHGLVTSSHSSNGQTDDPSLELMHRCRHAISSVGSRIFVYGGLRGDVLLDDFLGAENSPFHSDANNPGLTSERGSNMTTSKCTFDPISHDDGPESTLPADLSVDKESTHRLAEASAPNSVWQAAQTHMATPKEMMISSANSQVAGTNSDEAIGNMGGLVRQLSLDHFENESRRMIPFHNDISNPAKRFMRQKSPQGLHKKVISALLKPQNWKPPANRKFFLDSYEVGELCYAAEQIFMHEPTVLQLGAPIKIHDPENFHLIRGNHEAADINALFGFRLECIERMGEHDGIWAWQRFNQLFNHLPLAALIENKIICMHGGIGRSIHLVEQIERLERPITMDAGSIVRSHGKR
ncbi:Kelch-type beta propeller [Cynara cardunculus var. scolymus]|uniref:Serine/threonine-protein phosphatase n=1 Tax=Cynara cardunculus var. scolymus TaxID=59895 RepID=A0A124SIE3_CYNCS|nr:Kelch-type beta propeller [Cynara cardunculus var. scolymus]